MCFPFCLKSWVITFTLLDSVLCSVWNLVSPTHLDIYIPLNSLLDEEKKMVEEVFSNAIDCLSDEDKKLPQVCLMSLSRV